MKRIIYPLALAAILFSSCKKENIATPETKTDMSTVLFRVKEVDLDGTVMTTPFYNVGLTQAKMNITASEISNEDDKDKDKDHDHDGLPVIWTEVKFQLVSDSDVKCTFTTVSESNVDKYLIESTKDQVSYKTLAVIKPKGSSTYETVVTP